MAVALDGNQKVLDEARELSGSGLDKLCWIYKSWAESSVTDFGRSIVLMEAHTLSEASRQKHKEMLRLVLNGIEDLIQEGMDDGSIRTCHPAVVTLALMGLFQSPARWYREEGPLSIDEITTELLTLLEQGLANTAK